MHAKFGSLFPAWRVVLGVKCGANSARINFTHKLSEFLAQNARKFSAFFPHSVQIWAQSVARIFTHNAFATHTNLARQTRVRSER